MYRCTIRHSAGGAGVSRHETSVWFRVANVLSSGNLCVHASSVKKIDDTTCM
jgi:hypothetical protein